MIGCLVLWKCFVACLFGEESQHPTCPHSMHIRRWTHVPPILKQSSQPLADGFTLRIWFRWVHSIAAPSLNPILSLYPAVASALAFTLLLSSRRDLRLSLPCLSCVIPEGDLLLLFSLRCPTLPVVTPEGA